MTGEIFESRVSLVFFAGLSTSVALFVTHPIEIIKMNVQLKSMTVSEALDYHYMKDRGMALVYKGFLGSMARSMVSSNIRFELYEIARRRNMLNDLRRKLIAASASGAIGGFLSTPITKVYVRMLNDDLHAPNERRYYTGLANGLYRTYREEGFHAMFRGATNASLRGVMTTIGQLALYDEMKVILLRHPEHFGDDFTTYLIASVTAGFFATILQQPFDVVNVKVMHSNSNKLSKTSDIVRSTYRRHGIKGFYKGLIPSCVRLIIHTVVTYMILESLRAHYGKLIKSRKVGENVEIIDDDKEIIRNESDSGDTNAETEEEKCQQPTSRAGEIYKKVIYSGGLYFLKRGET